MNQGEDVLERKVIPPGKPFIKAGEEHARAYIVQTGIIQSYIMEGDQKVEVAQYGPGRIIGEICLMSDEPMTMYYEALESSTVVTLTRAEFQKKISKMDKNVSTILEHVMNKLNLQYAEDVDKAMRGSEMDQDTFPLVDSLLTGIAPERRHKYEKAITPHVNALLKEIKILKAEDN